eukprot:3220721-Prymnesium_polylepis.1
MAASLTENTPMNPIDPEGATLVLAPHARLGRQLRCASCAFRRSASLLSSRRSPFSAACPRWSPIASITTSSHADAF